LEFSCFSLDALGNAHHSGCVVHLVPRSGPRRHRADHLSPRVGPCRHLGVPLTNRTVHLVGPRHHHAVLLAPRVAHLVGPHHHRAVLLVPHAAHPAGPCCHRAVLLAPRAAHPAGPRRHRVVPLAPRATHPAGPHCHYIDRHARELRILGGYLMTFHCLLRPQCSFGTKCTSQGPWVLNCNTVYAPSHEYPQASPLGSRGVNLFSCDDHYARRADQLAPCGVHLGDPHHV
jgi:hypothetical protein